MPIDVKFDEDRELLHVTLTGAFPTLPEIVAERSRLILSGYIRPSVVELIDARALNHGIPNLAQANSLLHAIGNPPLKRAVLVSATVQYNAGRVAETLDPSGVKVFKEETAAVDWLLAGRALDANESVVHSKLR